MNILEHFEVPIIKENIVWFQLLKYICVKPLR